ncbi:MAG: DoxX family protein [Acidobacteriaceae bacterium]
MKSKLHKPLVPGESNIPRAINILFWVFTGLFCLEMSFTAYYELLPQGALAFARLGFANGAFRYELSLAKLVGVAVLLLPMIPARLKEWAYAGFAINLISAVIAHSSIADRRLAFVPSTLTGVLWAASYFFWRRRENARADQNRNEGPSGSYLGAEGALATPSASHAVTR